MLVAGFDEAGRGPLAGPVTAGCVVLPAGFPLGMLDDSKRLSEKRREAAERAIKEAACWGLGVVGHEEIDGTDILRASLRAMRIAFWQMAEKLPAWASSHGGAPADFGRLSDVLEGIADGNRVPDVPIPCRAEPKADGTYPCVMAASIIAKVARDRIMVEADALYPEYGYARHKGYPTKEHREICRRLGPSPIQRLTFTY